MRRTRTAVVGVLTVALSHCTCGTPQAPDDAPVVDAGGPVDAGPACSDGLTLCDGGCVDTTTSSTDCGSCGEACARGAACAAGVCSCPHGQMACRGACTDTMTDTVNCGACRIDCTTPLTACESGVCVCPDNGRLCDDTCCAAGSSCTDSSEWALWPIPPDAPPDAEYDVSPDGTVVTDTVTQLLWQRVIPSNPCPSDGPGVCTAADAKAYCEGLSLGGDFTHWRLPTMIELISISDLAVGSPAIDLAAFPDTPWNGQFWTSTLDARSASLQWDISIYEGDPETLPTTGLVRCVHPRALPELCAVAGDAPTGRYVLASGVVTDTVTGLTWQQIPPGSGYPWSGAGGPGSAQAYCQSLHLGGFTSGWRLPSVKELVSIVDVYQGSPAVDPSAFPNTATERPYWTSTLNAITAGGAWAVDFSTGAPNYYVTTSTSLNVRCVR